jgi:DNA-binding transcriptional LysR family regulator
MASGRPKGERDQWLTVEMRHLAALATVAREASFTEAADRLGYVQSAISQQIAYLERIVGHELVERSGRPRSVTLTEAGAVLVHHIEQILEQLRLAKHEVDAVGRQAEQPVSLGMANGFGPWLLARILARGVADTGREAWVRLERGRSATLLDAVRAGRLDAAFVELPIASGPFFAMELLREDYALVVPRTAGHADRTVEAALRHWSLVSIDGCRATHAVLERMKAAGSDVEVRHTAASPGAALSFVRAGTAAAVMTRRDVLAGDGSLALLALLDVPERVLGLAWRRDRDEEPAIAELRSIARRAFPVLAQPGQACAVTDEP